MLNWQKKVVEKGQWVKYLGILKAVERKHEEMK